MRLSREDVEKVREVRRHAAEYMKNIMHAKELEHHAMLQRGVSWDLDVEVALQKEKERQGKLDAKALAQDAYDQVESSVPCSHTCAS